MESRKHGSDVTILANHGGDRRGKIFSFLRPRGHCDRLLIDIQIKEDAWNRNTVTISISVVIARNCC
jgi:hypothetical protein